MSGKEQRTEKASPQRLRKAREDGRFPISREFVGAIQFAVFVGIATGTVDAWWPACLSETRRLLLLAFRLGDLGGVATPLLQETIYRLPVPFTLAGGAVFAAGLAAQLASTGFGLASGKLAPDLNRLNPGPKLSGLWQQNTRSTAEAMALLACVAVVVAVTARGMVEDQATLSRMTVRDSLQAQGQLTASLLWKAVLFLLVWGAVDLFRSRRRYMDELKMTKQEIREEHRQNDGSPEIKMRIRRLRRELLRRRMMSAVAEATAVITNPTHYAVALKYEFGSSGAPKVVAKGKNFLAMRIRQRAAENQVPVIENPPLARALYAGADVGSEIPAHLYRAVAEVLAYVFRVLGRNHGKDGR
jgi:flagellar biosynthetic protein FlhB